MTSDLKFFLTDPPSTGILARSLGASTVVQAAKRERTEVEKLLEKHYDALLRRALRLCGDPDLARDLVQDTFERALRHHASFAPGTNLLAWLQRILANLFLDQYRRREVVKEVAIEERHDVAAEPPDEPSRLTPEQVQTAVAALSPLSRTVIEFRELQGMTYDDIAARLEIPRNTVGTRLKRARDQLRCLLEDLVRKEET